jgi:ABC-type antimicrobial peptide transport system permease subunit
MQNIVGITGLSVGFLCFSISLSLIEWQTGYDTEYPKAGSMYFLKNEFRSNYQDNIYNLPSVFPEIEKMTFVKNRPEEYEFVEPETEKTHRLFLSECDTIFIRFFALKILAGSESSIHRTENSIVLYETAAKKIDKNFRSLIGKTIQAGDKSYQITGIIKKPANTRIGSLGMDGLVINRNNGYFKDGISYQWDPSILNSFVLINDKVSVRKFQETLSNHKFNFELIDSRLGYHVNDDGSITKIVANIEQEHFSLSPLNDPFKDKPVTSYLKTFLIGLLILLVALFNYISFQTAQFYNRLKECALRRVNGAGKRHLFYLFFTEIVLAFLITYFLSILLLNIFDVYIKEINWFYFLDVSVLKFQMLQYLFFVLLLAFVLCLIPVNIIQRISVRTVFLNISTKGKKGVGRTFLLFLQLGVLYLFLSAFLIAGLQINKYRSQVFNQLSRKEKTSILNVNYSDKNLIDNRTAIIKNLKASPFVKEVLINKELVIVNSEGLLINSKSGEEITDNNFDIPGFKENSLAVKYVHPHFFNFFRCELIKGTFFTEESSPRDVVVDETFASYYADNNPIGESFENYRIVGVIKNLNTSKNKDRFTRTKLPVFYTVSTDLEKGGFVLYIKVQDGKEKEVRQFIDQCLSEFTSSGQQYILTLDEEIDRVLYEEKALLNIMSVLFVISLIICLLGIYSAIIMNTEKRRKEVAIRKINGATIQDILLLFGKTYMGLWTLTCILFFPVVYYYGNQWLSNYIDRISLNISLFLIIYLIVLILIIATIIYQILKIARCNPAEVLKTE